MSNKVELELYTRPICSDCQDAKHYLDSKGISYTGKDVAENVNLEQEMMDISGNRIVPLFAFYKQGFWGKKRLVKYFIGFENNKEEIIKTLSSHDRI